MRRKLLSLALTLVVCLGLTVPAFAAESAESPIPTDEALENLEVEILDENVAMQDLKVDKTWILGDWDFVEGEEIQVPETQDYYVAIKKDTQFKVTHSGTVNDGSTIMVYITVYENDGNGIYDWTNWPHSYYLTKNNGFIDDILDPDAEGGGLVELKAGESVTFTLPFQWFEDDIIEVRPTIYYPQYDYSYWWYAYFKVDEAAYNAAAKGANPTTAPSTGFTDVAAGAYYAEPVKWAIEKGITNGTGNNQFSPNQNCTNAQILTFLWRAYGQPEPSISSPFTNTIPDAYLKAAVWAYEKGMVSGSTFDVNGLCSRALAVTYMWQAAGSPAPAAAAAFDDVPAGAAFAAAVSWAVEKEVTAGTSGTTFSPNDTCTRGQIATFLYRNLAK